MTVAYFIFALTAVSAIFLPSPVAAAGMKMQFLTTLALVWYCWVEASNGTPGRRRDALGRSDRREPETGGKRPARERKQPRAA
jgi:hypothetical protein